MWKMFGSMFSGNICCWLAKFTDASSHYEDALSLWDPKYSAFAATPEDLTWEALATFPALCFASAMWKGPFTPKRGLGKGAAALTLQLSFCSSPCLVRDRLGDC
jgi:hypothetical protein